MAEFFGADQPIVIRVKRDQRFEVGSGDDHLGFEAIGEDLQRGRAQPGIMSVREAGSTNEKRCQPATQTIFPVHQLMRVSCFRLVFSGARVAIRLGLAAASGT